jgi:hypothetical protein
MHSTKVADILRPDLAQCESTAEGSTTEVNHLSSYNWIEASEPTIDVSGSPALWTPPKTPQNVAKDSGLIYSAQNAARQPDSPLEPLFRALSITNPSFDFQSVDLVADRNNIRSYGYLKLLSSSAHITSKVYSRYRESKMSLLTSSDGGETIKLISKSWPH